MQIRCVGILTLLMAAGVSAGCTYGGWHFVRLVDSIAHVTWCYVGGHSGEGSAQCKALCQRHCWGTGGPLDAVRVLSSSALSSSSTFVANSWIAFAPACFSSRRPFVVSLRRCEVGMSLEAATSSSVMLIVAPLSFATCADDLYSRSSKVFCFHRLHGIPTLLC